MKTIVIDISDEKTKRPHLAQAAAIIKSGGLVAFPTETVYGLGANALDAAACAKVYAAKGRPADNPLIMHIADAADLIGIAAHVPPAAGNLMRAFWPGPLTVILPAGNVPRGTFLDTVAVRMPKNPIAQQLIRLAAVPIAAPSANLSGRPSPTTAAHVLQDLDGKIDMILDGGPCKVGLESTVIDFSGDVPTILRPGFVTREMVEGLIGPVDSSSEVAAGEAPKSPGMKYRHYAPKAKLTIVTGSKEDVRRRIKEMACVAASGKAAIMAAAESAAYYGAGTLIMGESREDIAANLFAMLRKCDEMGLDEVFVEGVAEEGLGVAIMERLKKAAAYNVTEV